MNLIDLVEDTGLSPILVAQTNGGEFVCACPSCGDGGKGNNSDRFHVWPNEKAKNCNGRYWCRKCGINGDSIQFCRTILGLTFGEACRKLSLQTVYPKKSYVKDLTKDQRKFADAPKPNLDWQKNASAFLDWSQCKIRKHPEQIELLNERGFNGESIERWKLGYCPQELWRERAQWGLCDKFNSKGIPSKLWLPQGIVIPSFSDGNIVKLKIRSNEETHKKTSPKFQKYIIVSGSRNAPTIHGDLDKPILIMESELDAMLTFDIVGDICSVVALGGAQNRPDAMLHQILLRASHVLLSLDFDEGGMKANYFWKELYPTLRFWPVPRGKSPGDALQLGVDLKRWVEDGLKITVK